MFWLGKGACLWPPSLRATIRVCPRADIKAFRSKSVFMVGNRCYQMLWSDSGLLDGMDGWRRWRGLKLGFKNFSSSGVFIRINRGYL